MSTPAVLLLGTRKGMLEACNRRHLPVTVLTTAPLNIELEHSPIHWITVPSLRDPAELLRELHNHQHLHFCAVATDYEDGVPAVAVLQEVFQTPKTLNFSTALVFRDKYLQKKLLDQHLMHAPIELLKPSQNAGPQAGLSFPVVVKPVDGVSSRATHVVHDLTAWQSLQQQLENDAQQRYVVEGFVDGPEWHLDGWVQDGEVSWFSASRYLSPLIHGKTGGVLASVCISPDHTSLYQQFRTFLGSALKALGLSTGVFHLECFETPAGWVYGECAARAGGAFVVETIAHKYGINLYDITLQLALGEHPAVEVQEDRLHTYGFVLLPPPVDPSSPVPTAKDFLELPGVVECEYKFTPDQPRPDPQQFSSARAGMCVVKADTEARALELMQNLVECARHPERIPGLLCLQGEQR